MRKRQGIGPSTGDVAKVCDGQELVCDDQESENAKKSEPPPARRTSSRSENNVANQAAKNLQRATSYVLSLATKSSPDVPFDFGRYMISILPAHLQARSELVPFALLLMLLLVMVAYPTGSFWDSKFCVRGGVYHAQKPRRLGRTAGVGRVLPESTPRRRSSVYTRGRVRFV